jgi:two-component system, cell cycle sensor histidine kinase and response regulator CckA
MTFETNNVTFDDDDCTAHPRFLAGEYVRIAVSDNGCGMDQETLGHIFEPFFTTKAVGEGTGLGLATVYGVVRQNNGFINVYSEPGQGTTFAIYLPRHVGAAATARKKGTTEAPLRGQEAILWVEDKSSILELITVMLRRQGYTVLAASTRPRPFAWANSTPAK